MLAGNIVPRLRRWHICRRNWGGGARDGSAPSWLGHSQTARPAIAGSIAAAVVRGARQAYFQKRLSVFRKTFSVCSIEIEKKVLRVTKDPLSWPLIIFTTKNCIV